MKIQANRTSLLAAVTLAGTAIHRGPKPILRSILMTVDPGAVTLYATDLEVSVRCEVAEVQIDRPGQTLLPFEKVRDILKCCTDDTITIELARDEGSETDTLKIHTQDTHLRLYVSDPSEFPREPELEDPSTYSLPTSALQSLLRRAAFAVATEATRYAFNGCLFAASKKRLTIVSTDGRRLALANGTLSTSVSKSVNAIVPKKALNVLEKLNSGTDENPETLVVSISENRAVFRSGRVTVGTNLVEGAFPPYGDVIPKDVQRRVSLPRADFLSALRRASLLNEGDVQAMRFKFDRNRLVMDARNAELGECNVTLPCRYEGNDIAIGFNPHQIADWLEVVDVDDVKLEMTASNRPGLLKAGDEFLYVIMPMNLEHHAEAAK